MQLSRKTTGIHIAVWSIALLIRAYLLNINLGDRLLLLDFAMYAGYFYLNAFLVRRLFFASRRLVFFLCNLLAIASFSFIQAYATVLVFGNEIVVKSPAESITFFLDNSLENQWTMAIYFNIVVFVLSFAYSTYRSTLRQQKEKQEIINSQLTNQLSSMRSQVNPQLIISMLWKINSELDQRRQEETAENLERLSEIMRYMISRKGNHYVPLKEELYQAGILSSLLNRESHNTFESVTVSQSLSERLKIEATLLLSLLETVYLLSSERKVIELSEFNLEKSLLSLTFNLDQLPQKSSTAFQKMQERLKARYPDSAILSAFESPQPQLKLELDLV